MIPARMFVSDPQNSPGCCLMGHPTIITAPPWELVGQFLTSEMDSSKGWLFQRLPRILGDCASGQRTDFSGGTEGFDVAVRGQTVSLETLFADPAARCDVPLDAFLALLQQWRKFVRSCERAATGKDMQ